MITSFFKVKKKDTKQRGSTTTSTPPSSTSSSSSSPSLKRNSSSLVTPDNEVESTPSSKRVKHDTPVTIESINTKLSQIPCDETKELLSHLTDDSWRMKLATYVTKPSFTKLAKFVASERASKTVYPPPCDVFSALNSVPIDNVKVVIVGQDPYHQPNQGHGLAFSVRKGIKIPPSLRNIYKELLNNENCGLKSMPKHGYLNKWCSQGVLLLNAVLTVRNSEPNSHAKKGWEEFTDEIIRLIIMNSMAKVSSPSSSSSDKIIFLLWGKPASKKAETIINRYGRGRHIVISSSHPSPLGATKTKSPFIGSKCFARANEALVAMGKEPIQWNVE